MIILPLHTQKGTTQMTNYCGTCKSDPCQVESGWVCCHEQLMYGRCRHDPIKDIEEIEEDPEEEREAKGGPYEYSPEQAQAREERHAARLARGPREPRKPREPRQPLKRYPPTDLEEATRKIRFGEYCANCGYPFGKCNCR